MMGLFSSYYRNRRVDLTVGHSILKHERTVYVILQRFGPLIMYKIKIPTVQRSLYFLILKRSKTVENAQETFTSVHGTVKQTPRKVPAKTQLWNKWWKAFTLRSRYKIVK
jgi:hypothetical protein